MIDSDYSVEGRRRSSEEREREWENEKRVRGWRRVRGHPQSLYKALFGKKGKREKRKRERGFSLYSFVVVGEL